MMPLGVPPEAQVFTIDATTHLSKVRLLVLRYVSKTRTVPYSETFGLCLAPVSPLINGYLLYTLVPPAESDKSVRLHNIDSAPMPTSLSAIHSDFMHFCLGGQHPSPCHSSIIPVSLHTESHSLPSFAQVQNKPSYWARTDASFSYPPIVSKLYLSAATSRVISSQCALIVSRGRTSSHAYKVPCEVTRVFKVWAISLKVKVACFRLALRAEVGCHTLAQGAPRWSCATRKLWG